MFFINLHVVYRTFLESELLYSCWYLPEMSSKVLYWYYCLIWIITVAVHSYNVCSRTSQMANRTSLKTVMIGCGLRDWILLLFSIQL